MSEIRTVPQYFFKTREEKKVTRQLQACVDLGWLSQEDCNGFLNLYYTEDPTNMLLVESFIDAQLEASDERIKELKKQLEICQKKQHRLGGDIDISLEPTKLNDSLKH